MAAFETAYRNRIAPILEKHGLVEFPSGARPAPENVFSRLFALHTPTQILEKQQSLDMDPTWLTVLQDLGADFNAAGPDGRLQHSLALYTTPSGSGTSLPAGLGTVVHTKGGSGHWRTYDTAEGLAGGTVLAI